MWNEKVSVLWRNMCLVNNRSTRALVLGLPISLLIFLPGMIVISLSETIRGREREKKAKFGY